MLGLPPSEPCELDIKVTIMIILATLPKERMTQIMHNLQN